MQLTDVRKRNNGSSKSLWMGGRQRFGAGVGKQDKCSSSKTKNNLHGIVWNGWLLNFGGSIG